MMNPSCVNLQWQRISVHPSNPHPNIHSSLSPSPSSVSTPLPSSLSSSSSFSTPLSSPLSSSLSTPLPSPLSSLSSTPSLSSSLSTPLPSPLSSSPSSPSLSSSYVENSPGRRKALELRAAKKREDVSAYRAGGAISWRSGKQGTIASSTTEAEFIACHDALPQATWLRNFIMGLGVVDTISKPLLLYCDDFAAVFFSKNNKFTNVVAIVRLWRIEQGGAYADILSGEGSKDEIGFVEQTLGFHVDILEPRSQRQVTEVVAGVTRWKRYLDFLICSVYDHTDYDKMEPLLRQILRIGVYELVKLGISPHAVVYENVKLGKASLRDGAGSLINWLLRQISSMKREERLPSPGLEGDKRARARGLATIYSHPVWLVRRWIEQFGEECTIELMKWNNAPPMYALRLNETKGISRDDLLHQLENLEVPHRPSFLLPNFICIMSRMQTVIHAGLIQEGICTVQDESTGLIVKLVDPQPGEIIVDCCAAPGGKALYMASLLNGQGKVIAIDIHGHRLRKLTEAAVNLDLSNVVDAVECDLSNFSDIIGFDANADKVLLDAPCSGLGVLSKRPDLRWRRSLKSLEESTMVQKKLLDAAARLVKPGGVLVYSTCSIDSDENENQIAFFLDHNPEFYVESAENYLPHNVVTEEGYFASLPHRDHIDGAFAARLRRRYEYIS